MLRVFFICVAMAILAFPGHAAVLTDIEGTILVDRGTGEVATVTPAQVEPGTRVRAAANSAVTLFYDNGCRVRIEAGQSRVVESAPQCPEAAQNASGTQTAVIVGGLVVGGVVAGIVAVAGGSASP